MSGYARRGFEYIKKHGVMKLYRKAQERLYRDHLERNYSEWMFGMRPADSEKELQREHRFAWEPVISIVVPVYRTPEHYLREMIESVLSQTYGKLELVLADGSGEDASAEQVIRGYVRQDGRVRYQRLEKNFGISGNTNAALALAAGDFIGFLDHDDLLEGHALFEIVKWLQEHPDTELLYTDEDKVSSDSGNYFQPHFKPDFNWELLKSNNYICHFLLVKRELAERMGGYRADFDGAQDYDYILRCCESAAQVGHISKVLYHWRTHSLSTAGNPESKIYAYEAGRRAVEEHLVRQGIDGRVEQMDDPGFYRLSYTLESVPKISIVLLDAEGLDTLKRFVRLAEKVRTYTNYEILVLLDAPEKNKLILNFIKEHRQTAIKVVYCNSPCNKFVTFSRLAEKLDGEFFVFLTSRIAYLSKGYLECFLGQAQRAQVGAVGGRVYDSAHRLCAGAKILGVKGLAGNAFEGLSLGYGGYFHKVVLQQNVHAVSGAAMMVRKKFFLEVGGFSEDVEDCMKDVDLCLKLEKSGLQNIYEPGVVLIKRGRKSRKRKALRPGVSFEKKWQELMKRPDSFYNSNLSLETTDYRIRKKS